MTRFEDAWYGFREPGATAADVPRFLLIVDCVFSDDDFDSDSSLLALRDCLGHFETGGLRFDRHFCLMSFSNSGICTLCNKFELWNMPVVFWKFGTFRCVQGNFYRSVSSSNFEV